MINIIWDDGFKRKYRKIVKSDSILKNKFWKLIEVFTKDPFDNRLKNP